MNFLKRLAEAVTLSNLAWPALLYLDRFVIAVRKSLGFKSLYDIKKAKL